MNGIQLNERSPLHPADAMESGLRYVAVDSALSDVEIIVPGAKPSTLQRASSYFADSSNFLQSQVRETQSFLVRSISNQILPRQPYIVVSVLTM